MLFSINVLKKMAQISKKIKNQEILNAFDSLGFEVKSFTKFSNVENLKFGKIQKISKNPNSDMLFVCEIQFADKKRIIQTNSPNIKIGMIVICFINGSKQGNIIFKNKIIKGILSEGMISNPQEYIEDKSLIREEYKNKICSYQINDLSQDPIEFLNLNDYIIDINFLPNRQEANSYLILAKELSAYFKIKIQNSKIENYSSFKNTKSNKCYLEINNIPNITIKEQLFLAKSGIAAKNNGTDLANLIFLITGKPVIAYDKEKIKNKINTKKITGQIKIDNEEINLENNSINISEEKIIGLPGIKSFANFAPSQNTKSLILEFDVLDNINIKKIIKKNKIFSHISVVSSKKLNQTFSLFAIKFLFNKKIDFKLFNFQFIENKRKIIFNIEKINEIAGFNIEKKINFSDLLIKLKILGFKFEENQKIIIAPSYRNDIKTIEDIAQEIFKHISYNIFPSINFKNSYFQIQNLNYPNIKLINQSYQEVITYSLVSKKNVEFNPFNFKNEIKLKSFISKEREFIRNSTIVSLNEIVNYYLKRKIENFSLFTYGMINNGIKSIGLASTINKNISEFENFQIMKKNIMQFLSTKIYFKKIKNIFLHPGMSAEIYYQNKKIGWIGKINPFLNFENIFFAEFIFDLNKTYENNFKNKDFSKNPLKYRDLTFKLKLHEDMFQKIQKINSIEGIFEIKLIDIYEKDIWNYKTFRIFGNEEAIKEIDKEYN